MSRANRIARLVAIQQDTEFVLLKHQAGKHDQTTHGSWDTDRSNNKSDFKYPVQDAIDKVVKGEVGKVVPADAGFWLDKMADRTDNPDLTNLEIVGTKLFTRDNLGIMRDEMPQVPRGAKDEFLSEMKKRGIDVTREKVSPKELHPIQAEISASKTGQIYRDLLNGGHKDSDKARIVVSSDGYVIDGHHRWAASAFMSFKNSGEKIPVLRVDMTHMELIDVVRAWNKALDIKPIALGESNKPFNKAWVEFELAVIKGILSTEMQKHQAGKHDQRTHGSWAGGGAGVDITAELDKVFFNADGTPNQETQDLIEQMEDTERKTGSSYGDNSLKIIAERQGFTGKPKTVATVSEIIRLQETEGGLVVYRGIADFKKDGKSYTAEQAVEQFKRGEYYAGFGAFGNGTYTTINASEAGGYADTVDEDTNVYGNGQVMAMHIPKNAKMPTKEQVRKAMKYEGMSYPRTHKNSVANNLAAQGFQVYNAGFLQDDKKDYFVVLDRSMITVAEENWN